jgi:hypothetical protein
LVAFHHRKARRAIARPGRPSATASNRSSAQYEMQDQSDDRENQQQMDESTGHMKYGEASQPCDQQNDKQNRPNAHVFSFV